MYLRIDHVAVAVHSLESALKIYGAAMGFENWHIEEIPEQKTRVAMLPIGESHIELLEATEPESPVAAFLKKRGEGLHHICFEVEDLELEIIRLKEAGVRLVNGGSRSGAGGRRIVFIHPSSTNGVLMELTQADVNQSPDTNSRRTT